MDGPDGAKPSYIRGGGLANHATAYASAHASAYASAGISTQTSSEDTPQDAPQDTLSWPRYLMRGASGGGVAVNPMLGAALLLLGVWMLYTMDAFGVRWDYIRLD